MPSNLHLASSGNQTDPLLDNLTVAQGIIHHLLDQFPPNNLASPKELSEKYSLLQVEQRLTAIEHQIRTP